MKMSDSEFWDCHYDDFVDALSEINWTKIMVHVDAARQCEIGEEIYVHLYKIRRIIEADEQRDNYGPSDDADLDDPRHGQADGLNRGDLR